MSASGARKSSATRFISEQLNFGYPPWIDIRVPKEEAYPKIYQTLVEEFATISQHLHTSYTDCYKMSWRERQIVIEKLAAEKKEREKKIEEAKKKRGK